MRRTPRKKVFRSDAAMIRRSALVLWALLLLLGGCAAGAKSSVAIRYYALEYSSPSFNELAKVSESIRVEPLSIARTFSTASMVYRSRPYVYGDDAYNRWKVKPSVMISDLLLRDMKSTGLFSGVFSTGDTENGDYALSGVIEELYEQEEKGASQAVLDLNVTLLSTSRQNPGGRLIFQNHYRSVQVMQKSDAESMARSMSKAMEALSKEIVLDTYKAIRRNGDPEKSASYTRGLSAR
jgi:ABC-type uncharacterized transport system auxiliary subunit